MKHPIVKAIGAAILICAMLIGYYHMVITRINIKNKASIARSSTAKLESVIEAMGDIEYDSVQKVTTASDRLLAFARLEAAILRQSADGTMHAAAAREKGMVVRVSDGRVIYPAGTTDRFDDYGDLFRDVSTSYFGTVRNANSDETRPALFCACLIKDDQYYVAWIDSSDDPSLFTLNSEDETKLKASVEISHDGYYMDIVDSGEQLAFEYRSHAFEEYDTPEALGITREILEVRPDILKIDGVDYYCAYKTIREGEETGLFLRRLRNPITQAGSQAVIITALAGIILVSVMAWLLATQIFVVEKILTKPMQSRYKPSKMRWKALVVGGISIVIVFVTGCVVYTISDFFARSVEAFVSLSVFDAGMTQNESLEASDEQSLKAWQLTCGRRLAKAIETEPGFAAEGTLAEFSAAIGTQYIMLFDGDGNETACSTRYTGFSLGTQAEDSTTDFRRLLLGVPELVHDPAVDERTGLNTRMVGIGCRMPDGRYGALLLAFEPDAADQSVAINDLIHSQTEPGWITLVFDRESMTVRFSGNPEYIDASAEQFGLSEDNFGVRYIDTIRILDRNCYCFCINRDNLVFYYISTENVFAMDTALYGARVAGGFAIMYLILVVYLLFGYTNKWYAYYSVIGAEYDTSASETVLPNGKVKRSIDPSRRWAFSFTDWHNILPEQAGKSVFRLCLGLCMGWSIVDILVHRYNANGVFAFIVSGEWNRGFNLFAVVAILMLSLAIAVALMLLRFALKLTSMALDTKGETICRLVYNLLQYVAVLGLLFYSFEFLGIDVRALLAPLALVSLALSLGSRQLVEDILAGITIVFEGEYQVGDVIDVGGYRGKVVEVGVRTTKLLGKGDNIKIISNRDVRNVLNMSRMNSWIDMEFTIASTVPMHKIEEIMERELPKIGRSIPDIISGPTYKGIVSMNGNKITIAITCECNEERSFRIQRKLYAKFHEMFERENLPLA